METYVDVRVVAGKDPKRLVVIRRPQSSLTSKEMIKGVRLCAQVLITVRSCPTVAK